MMTLGPYELNTIVTGDARELAEALPDCSVDLVFTDPIYENIADYEWLAETAARVLKPDSVCLTYLDLRYLDKVIIAMAKYLKYIWQNINNIVARQKIVLCPTGISRYRPILVFSNGEPSRRNGRDLINVPYNIDVNKNIMLEDGQRWPWTKPEMEVNFWLNTYSRSDSIVFDPFTGGGTVPAVCKMLGRDYLAFEIDPATADKARQRVLMTQPPLFVVQPEQVPMFV